MALPTGSGTETLHSHIFMDVDLTQTLIHGVQHHVYTVLSIIICCRALSATTATIPVSLMGFNSHAGGADSPIDIFVANPQVNETFVWNDKFSFNGHEPTGLSGAFGAGDNAADIAYQTAIAAQGSSTPQWLFCTVSDADDNYDITVTYIDQDNNV